MLREALKISSPLALVSREVPRFHGGHSGTLHHIERSYAYAYYLAVNQVFSFLHQVGNVDMKALPREKLNY